MESLALFVVASHLGVRALDLLSLVGNQRACEAAGLSSPIVHDTEAIKRSEGC